MPKLHHIETSQLICTANQLTGFYMMATLEFNELIQTSHERLANKYTFRVLASKKTFTLFSPWTLDVN